MQSACLRGLIPNVISTVCIGSKIALAMTLVSEDRLLALRTHHDHVEYEDSIFDLGIIPMPAAGVFVMLRAAMPDDSSLTPSSKFCCTLSWQATFCYTLVSLAVGITSGAHT